MITEGARPVRQLFLSRGGTPLLEGVPPPTRGSGEVLVDVVASLLAPVTPAPVPAPTGRWGRLLAGLGAIIQRWREAGAYCTWQYARSRRRTLTPTGWSVAGRVTQADESAWIGRVVIGVGVGVAVHAERVRLPAGRIVFLPADLDPEGAPLVPALAVCLRSLACARRECRGRVRVPDGFWGSLAALAARTREIDVVDDGDVETLEISPKHLDPSDSATAAAMAEAIAVVAALSSNELERLAPRIPVDAEAAWREALARCRGVLLLWSPAAAVTTSPRHVLASRAARRGAIRVGVVGCGAFAQLHHLPNLHREAACRIEAVAAASPASALQTARQYDAAWCTLDYREILRDPAIDLVMLLTRHDLHVPILLEAVAAGKSVFVEKPVAIDWQGLRALATVPSGARVTVGFNRRFARFAVRARQALAGRRGPAMVSYTANFGPAAAAWMADPVEGGGRLVGVACHYLDMVTWLVGARPTRISAETLQGARTSVTPEENFVVSVGYEDGSLATVWFSSLGRRGPIPKERIECFFDGDIIVVDDFRRFKHNDTSIASLRPDYGERGEVRALLASEGERGAPTVPLAEGMLASMLSLLAREALSSGRPVDVPVLERGGAW